MSTVSTNMQLQIPTIGTDTGPAWAAEINASLNSIDLHDHSSGKGVPITPNGISINAALPMNNNALNSIQALTLTAQASFSTNKSLYVVGNEIYFRDGAGNQVQITNGGSVNAGAGSITGLPSGTASVSYSSIAQTFTFQSATSTSAILDASSIILRNLSASSYGVTLQAPASLAANYNVVLPSLPASTKIVRMDSAGNLSSSLDVDNSTLQISSNVLSVKANGITSSQIANGAIASTQIAANGVARSNLVAVGQQTVSISGGTSSTTPVQISSNLTITTTGRPVVICLQAVPNSASYIGINDSSNSVANGIIELRRNSTANTCGNNYISAAIPVPGTTTTQYRTPSLVYLDAVAAGTYTYGIWASVYFVTATLSVANCTLVAYEL